MVNRPALVLADEPTGALDTANGRAVLELLTTLNDEGTTVAIITHDRDIAAQLPRRVEILDGRPVADVRREDYGSGEDTPAVDMAELADDTLAVRGYTFTDLHGERRS